MLDPILENPHLLSFFNEVKTAPSILIEHLWDAPKALFCLLAQKATGKNVLILSGKKEDRFLDNFPFFYGKEILDFLPWETLPSEEIQPSPDITGKRMEILYQLTQKKESVILHCSIHALMQKTLSPSTLTPLCRVWKKGQKIPFSSLNLELTALGYRRSKVASDKGEFAIRGGILDIFPIASSDPYRIDFFGDEIDSIRIYDPVGQKSIRKVDELFICPAQEWSLLKEEKKLSSLLDYLGPNTLICFDDLLAIEDQYVSLKSLQGMQSRLFFPLEELIQKLSDFSHLFWLEQKAEELSDVLLTERKGRKFYSGNSPFQPLSFRFLDIPLSTLRFHHPFEEIATFFSRFENREAATFEEIFQGIDHYSQTSLKDLRLIINSASEQKMIEDKLKELEIKLPQKASFQPGYLSSGFVLPDLGLVYLPTPELTHKHKIRRQKWRNTYHTSAAEFHELSPGDVVVHFHNGIGKFLGTQKRPNHQGQDTEYLQIEYASGSLLYVPVSQSHLVSRYIGSSEEIPTLNTLGSNKWQKTCQKAHASVLGYAKELLLKMAERAVHPGFRYEKDSLEMQLFEEEFPFTETEDQLAAIAAIKEDMTSSKIMDRLICGDVGYGKTEVAMRAAFKAVYDGKKQVAVLVPTTVLAMQHYDTFVARMANFPIQIGVLSRFCTAKEVKETLKKASEGKVDIIIGTHRLLSKDLIFKDLGLLIIDEEQRFGVKAKEHLKAMKCGIDCLTLSATPIPRTLYMSLVGAREISIINTPPQDRLPIKTIIAEKTPDLIHNALLREFSREGQAYFIHNRVETLPKIENQIQEMLPQAKILSGHGQMGAEELDTIFHSFKSGEADLLIATTIVENGIDIPNANTILVDRADQFGMADLYQLRGRVGRWNRPAFAYFLVSKLSTLPEIARKRLYALAEASGYGGGMKIAMRDLEIRGAGDILGDQQSGQVSAIGFHLYCRLLKKAVEALQKKQPIYFTETKMECNFDARLPEDYINESELRMELYYRLGNSSSFLEVNDILAEMIDRFGPAPKQVLLLLTLTKIRLEASSLHILSLKIDSRTVSLEKQKMKATLPLPGLKVLDSFESEMLKILREFAAKK